MRIECHVFAGLGGPLFARGTKALDKFMDDLSPVWDANHWWHGQWERACDGILARAGTHGDKPKVLLIGHSYGALRCIQIARRLKSNGLDVEYIAGIDPTALPIGEPPMTVPDNVRFVDEFHATSGWPHGARRRDPSGGRGGKYVYPASRPKDTYTVYRIPGGHIPCASDPETVRVVVNAVRALTREEAA